MNESEFDKIMDDALKVDLPAGLAERLEAAVDERASRSRRLRLLMPAAGLAASLLICAGILLSQRRAPMRDTFDDPREAALAAEQMLTLVSREINLGLEQVASVEREAVQHLSNLINEPFKNR
ncbi:MAG: hypothetical protein LBD21_10750 [Tannerellaceae bacterium]|jgi:hypothetical protein|nr:hypothetical protein [Tannerellaceae bacterium]